FRAGSRLPAPHAVGKSRGLPTGQVSLLVGQIAVLEIAIDEKVGADHVATDGEGGGLEERVGGLGHDGGIAPPDDAHLVWRQVPECAVTAADKTEEVIIRRGEARG